jgi:phosphatidylglycerophosphatase A
MRKIHFDRNFWVKFFSTGFFISSLMPFAPAIWGVVLGCSLALITNSWALIFKLCLLICLIFISIPLATQTEKILKKGKDPQVIVIDEVVGIEFAFLWFNLWKKITLFHISIPLFVLLTVIYTFFDAVEPFPIKKIEKLPGGWGIVLDDIMAGIYTIASLIIILRIFG